MSHFNDQSRGNYRNYYLRRRANHTDLAPDRDERLDLLANDDHGNDIFKNKVVLDVGCNSGAVSTEIGESRHRALKSAARLKYLNLAQLHHARRVIGVDIDVDLIQACSGTVQQAYSIQKPLSGKPVVTTELEKRKKRRKLTSDQVEADPSIETAARYFPACFPALYDIIPINPRSESSTSSSGAGTSTSTETDRKRKGTSPQSHNMVAFPQNLVFYAADWAEEEIETDTEQYDVILA
jgi:7SK snRNA methylphosphate capping enzyme